jgi:hypothetical protein
MNWQRGLERMSAVWWGFWAAAALVGVGAFAFQPAIDLAQRVGIVGVALGGALFTYAAHRITCWVIAGFFAPRS